MRERISATSRSTSLRTRTASSRASILASRLIVSASLRASATLVPPNSCRRKTTTTPVIRTLIRTAARTSIRAPRVGARAAQSPNGCGPSGPRRTGLNRFRSNPSLQRLFVESRCFARGCASSNYSETARVQAKLRVVVLSSYNLRVVFCNGVSERALDRVLGEALPCEVAGGFRAGAAPRADASCPDRLGIEGRDRSFDGPGRQAARL